MRNRTFLVCGLVMAITIVTSLPPTYAGGQEEAVEKAEVILWMHEDPLADEAFEQIAKDFNQSQNNWKVVVEVQPGGLGDYYTKVQMALASGRGPDIFHSEINALPNWIENNWVQSTPESLVKWIEDNAAVGVVKDAMYHEGVAYGVPYGGDWQVLFYRRDFFEDAGISYPPKTWDDLVSAAKKLTKYDANGNVVRSGWYVRKSGYAKGITDKWQVFYYLFGGEMFNEDEKRTLVNTKPGYQAAQLYYDAVNVWKVDSFDVEGDFGGLGKGTTSMVFRESFALGYLAENFPNLDYSTAPVPKYQGYTTSVASGDLLMVSSLGNNPKGAWEFAEYFISDEPHLKYCTITNKLPQYEFATRQPAFANSELHQAWFNQENIRTQTVIYRSEEILSIIGEYVEKITRGAVPVKQGMDMAAEEVNKILAEIAKR